MRRFKSPPIHRTPIYRARAAWSNMRRRALNACGTEPAYTAVELRMTEQQWIGWAVPRYDRFLRQHPHASPAVSRKNDTGHYEVGNIEITTHKRNRCVQTVKKATHAAGRKTCSACQTEKPVEEFSVRRTAADGLQSQCRTCKSAAGKAYKRKSRARSSEDRAAVS